MWVRGSSIGIKNLAIVYPGVFIANRIGWNFYKTNALWILGLPEDIPGLELLG